MADQFSYFFKINWKKRYTSAGSMFKYPALPMTLAIKFEAIYNTLKCICDLVSGFKGNLQLKPSR